MTKQGNNYHGVARVALVAGLSAVLLGGAYPLAEACTQVYVGRAASADGNTYVGRNEDFTPRKLKMFGIQEPRENVTYTSLESPLFKLETTGKTARYTYIRDHKDDDWEGNTHAYSEAGINEYGVSASATLTADYNDKIAAKDPVGNAARGKEFGIGEFNLVDVILGHAKTAREGVAWLGKVIDKHGAYDPNLVTISDNKETWIFQMLSGHQWVAFKPDADKVSVAPNTGRLEYKIDLNSKDVLHSKDIIKTAEEAGSLKKFEDGTPNIAASYGAETRTATTTRYIQGRAYFGNPLPKNRYTMATEKGQPSPMVSPELLFSANRKISTFEALRSLAARGEETTDFNTNTNPSIYPIGNKNNAESHMFQIRHNLPANIATVQWTMLSHPEFNVSIPSYSALLTKVDEDIYPTMDKLTLDHVGARGKGVEAALKDAGTKALDYTMMDIYTLVNANRGKFAKPTKAYFDALQKQVIEQQKLVDAKMQKLAQSRATKDELIDFANKAHATISREVQAKAQAVLEELRAATKDPAHEFKIADFDPAALAVMTSLTYAHTMEADAVAPAPAPVPAPAPAPSDEHTGTQDQGTTAGTSNGANAGSADNAAGHAQQNGSMSDTTNQLPSSQALSHSKKARAHAGKLMTPQTSDPYTWVGALGMVAAGTYISFVGIRRKGKK